MERIKHKGIVQNIEKGYVFVRIVQASACSSCEVKSVCNSSEQKEKTVKVKSSRKDLNPGDEVVVTASKVVGYRAVFFAYLLPLIILLISLILCSEIFFPGRDAVVALVSLSIIALYYICLMFVRKYLDKSLVFVIEDNSEE